MPDLSFADLLRVETVRDGTLVRFNNQDLAQANARDLADELYDLASKGNGPHLYLDLESVESLPRVILLRLIVLEKKLQDLGDRLVVLNPTGRVREAIQASRLRPWI
jgi:anti-anti-sigma regulatory factor